MAAHALMSWDTPHPRQVDSELTTAAPCYTPAANTDTRISFDDTPISSLRPYITVGQVMRWQTQQHWGYANAFASSIMYASISGRGEKWVELWGPRGGSLIQEETSFKRRATDKILVMVGDWDDVIIAEEVKEDSNMVIGSIGAEDEWSEWFDERVVWRMVRGAGHEFLITRGEEVAGLIGKILDV
ncbi:hypothetical protein NHQ30_000320 [Ciborinia camelliae]|nr:hypothetical protein NHQ30_000320 [Ciborinia camelliae]